MSVPVSFAEYHAANQERDPKRRAQLKAAINEKLVAAREDARRRKQHQATIAGRIAAYQVKGDSLVEDCTDVLRRKYPGMGF